MTKNLILAFILTFIFLVFYQMFFFPKPQEKKIEESEKPQKPTVLQNPSPTHEDFYFFVITKNSEVKISEKTGEIRQITLKKFKNNGNPIELIPEFAKVANPNANLSWKPKTQLKDTFHLSETDTLTLSFEGLSQDTIIVTREITFYGNKYSFDISHLFHYPTYPPLVFEDFLKFTEKDTLNEKSYLKFQVNRKGKIKEFPFQKLKDEFFLGDEVTFLTYRTKYFLFGCIMKTPHKTIFISKSQNEKPQVVVDPDSISHLRIYFGPFDYFVLKEEDKSLASTYSFGNPIIAPFSKGILYFFHYSNKVIPNLGVVIILFSLIMKLIFFPLTRKTSIQMKKLQELKPKMETLQKIYKDDPKKLQQEMMELYKKYRVNPFSGCLPLLIQLPIFWALYSILRDNILFRGAPFVLWIKDLSLKDPYYILPILMGVFSLIQSFLQMTNDPQSKFFGIFFPVFLTFIFLTLPSGIVLYWLSYSIFSVLETLAIKKFWTPHKED